MRIEEIVRSVYDPAMQISPAQVEAIGSAILARSPGCRLLVFGLGRDTPLWLAFNREGETLLVEDDPAFLASAPAGARIERLDFRSHTTVGASFARSLADLDRVDMPGSLAATWDVILVDGPAGYHMDDPGRALPIRWASRVMGPGTHVFVDDYNRPLERHFADLLLRFDNPPCAVIPSEREAGKTMLWRIGTSVG